MLAGIGTVIVFGCVIVGTAFWALISRGNFLEEELGVQTSAQVCRSENRGPIDKGIAETLAALSQDVATIGNILTTPMGERAPLIDDLKKDNDALTAAADALTDVTRVQAAIIEACNAASIAGEQSPTDSMKGGSGNDG